MSMTVGQHDSAWLNVMTYQVPEGVNQLKSIADELRIQNQLRWLELIRVTQGADKIKDELLESFGKKLGFTFKDE